jgi:hypothetical protein
MKKVVTIPLVVVFAAVFSLAASFFPQTAQALELTVSPDGTILFFDDGVLGDSTVPLAAQRKPAKIIPSRSGNQVRIQASDRAVEVGVENRVQTTTNQPAAEETSIELVQDVDQVETQRIRAQFPTQITEKQIDALENEDQPEERSAYQRQLLEDRLDRTDSLEVRSNLNAQGKQEIEIRSKAAAAQLKGAEFTVEPETNTITITTPSGQEKTLNHLPDQALERIRNTVRLQNTDTATPDFSIETNEQNQLIYRTQGVKQKKFLGLFNRNVDAEVVLNDETGEVAETEKPSAGILGQFLDAFTF